MNDASSSRSAGPLRAGFSPRPSACLAVFAVAIVLAPAARAQIERPRPEQILLEARSRPAVRAMLVGYAREVETTRPGDAASALGYAAQGYVRAGRVDSALACYQKAMSLTNSVDLTLAAVDLRLQRGTDDDVRAAAGWLRPRIAGTPPGAYGHADVVARAMWLHHLEGAADSAARDLDEISRPFAFDDAWTLRAARVALEDARDPTRAFQMLLPLEIRARSQDPAVHEWFQRAATALGGSAESVQGILDAALRQRDGLEDDVVMRLGGRRVAFRGADDFPLGGVFLPPHPGRRAHPAVVISAGDTLVHYDSLLVHLKNAGFAVLVLDPRGHGRSRGPTCGSPLAWRGRENLVEAQVAGDVAAAVRAIGAQTKIDASAVLVVGSGAMSFVAVQAAEADSRVKAVVLASAEPARVDRGPMLAAVARLQRPLFLQIAPEDLVDLYYFTDALYQAGDRRRSRVSNAKSPGRYAEQFRNDPKSGQRLEQWLADVLPEKKP
jgi:pimeloyl-ACP methyl ester carboxylesterase